MGLFKIGRRDEDASDYDKMVKEVKAMAVKIDYDDAKKKLSKIKEMSDRELLEEVYKELLISKLRLVGK